MKLEGRDALHYGLEMFTYHAGQRMEMLKLFFLFEGAALAGYVGLVQTGRDAAAGGVAAFNLLLVIVFWSLDARNAELSRAAEGALAVVETSLSATFGAEALEIVRVADRGKKGFARFSRLMPMVFVLMILASGLGVAAGVARAGLI